MSSFLSDTYDKPKLVDSKTVKKIMIENKINTSFENKLKDYIINFIKNNYKVILITLIISCGLYWRYHETQKKKKVIVEETTETEDSEDS